MATKDFSDLNTQEIDTDLFQKDQIKTFIEHDFKEYQEIENFLKETDSRKFIIFKMLNKRKTNKWDKYRNIFSYWSTEYYTNVKRLSSSFMLFLLLLTILFWIVSENSILRSLFHIFLSFSTLSLGVNIEGISMLSLIPTILASFSGMLFSAILVYILTRNLKT